MDGAEGQEVTPGTEGVTPETGGDQPTETGGTTETPPQAWDWSEHADQQVAVKVDGQERLVPLRDAVDGYMRQADYTQKTQALSAQQQQLEWAATIAKALENDPAQALAILQQQYGVSPEQQQQEEFLTDEERQIAELRQWREDTEQREAVREVEAEVAQLQQTFGEQAFDPNELLSYAIQGNFPNLSAAFQSMKFNDLWGESQAARDARAQQEQQDAANQQAQEAKRAAGIVGGGHNVPPGSTQVGTPGERLTVRQAYERALQNQ
jgi:hypothetical protein